jgi:nitrilase
MNVLCCQVLADGVVTRADMESHQQRVAGLVSSACEDAAVDLVLLPELSAIEYSGAAFENLSELATTTDGWLCASMSKLAREINAAVCFGMPRREAEDYFISQVLIDRDGLLLGFYDKVHIAQFGDSVEKPYFTPGNRVGVFTLGGFRFGIVICYDILFGDYVSMVARGHGIDVMLHPVAFSRDGSFASWPSFVRTRALENQVYWLSLNRAGSGWGGSIFCPPWFERQTEVIELDESETQQVIELDRSQLEHAAKNYPIDRDRLGDYSSLLSPCAVSESLD